MCRTAKPFRLLTVFLTAVFLYRQPVAAGDAFPKKYTLVYPSVTRIVPPVRTTFYEVTRTLERVNGKTFRHPLNGGYGVVLKNPVTKRSMLHVGADLGWFRVGAPVYAVADGVVRVSRPALLAQAKAKGRPAPVLPPGAMLWGNFIAIEHKLKTGAYVTTFYGHLAAKRLVKVGDVVKAGQRIGSIGRQSRAVNGGYKPHLHFGVAYGRKLEKGRTLTTVRQAAKVVPVNVVDFTDEQVELDFGPLKDKATGFHLAAGGKQWRVEEKRGKLAVPARIMWSLQTPAFQLAGYANSKNGFLDPVKFLRNPQLVKPGLPSGNDIAKPFVVKALDIVGKAAPSWGIREWANLPAGKTSLNVSDYKGKIVAVFCFCATSPRCRKFGYAVWKKVLSHYEHDAQVEFVAVQTANENFKVNHFARAKSIAASFGRTIPVGQDGSARQKSKLIAEYGVSTTPWMIVIDTHGKVRINVILPDADGCIRLIELVKKFLRQSSAPNGAGRSKAPE